MNGMRDIMKNIYIKYLANTSTWHILFHYSIPNITPETKTVVTKPNHAKLLQISWSRMNVISSVTVSLIQFKYLFQSWSTQPRDVHVSARDHVCWKIIRQWSESAPLQCVLRCVQERTGEHKSVAVSLPRWRILISDWLQTCNTNLWLVDIK